MKSRLGHILIITMAVISVGLVAFFLMGSYELVVMDNAEGQSYLVEDGSVREALNELIIEEERFGRMIDLTNDVPFSLIYRYKFRGDVAINLYVYEEDDTSVFYYLDDSSIVYTLTDLETLQLKEILNNLK